MSKPTKQDLAILAAIAPTIINSYEKGKRNEKITDIFYHIVRYIVNNPVPSGCLTSIAYDHAGDTREEYGEVEMDLSDIKEVQELNQSNKIFRHLSVQQLLYAAISDAGISEVRSILDNTDWRELLRRFDE